MVAQPTASTPPPPAGFTLVGHPQAAPPTATVPAEPTTISNAPMGPLQWLKNLEGDVRYGTGTTLPGRVLQKMGAQGTNVGAQAGTQENALASPVLGPIRVAQGVVEAPKAPWQATKDIVGGAMQTASLPAQFMAPEGANAAINKIPSKEYAVQLFNIVMKDASAVPVTLTRTQPELTRLKELVDAAGKMPTGMGKVFTRVVNESKGPITYKEGRDIYSNISSLTADDAAKLSGPIKNQMVKVREAMKADIGDAAGQVGHAANYYEAMQNYAGAARLRRAGIAIAKYVGIPALATLGYEAGRDIYRGLKGSK